jgi:hypothetical protein
MVQQDIYHNCRNCNNRFDCNEKTDEGFCDDYIFDEEAATCDDCAKKEECASYRKNKPTCISWEPEVSCDECSRQKECNNYIEGGKICKKFKEIVYRLTEKGCLYLAMEEVQNTDKIFVNYNSLFEKGFFEELDHEMRLNGLVSEYRNIFEKMFKKLMFKLFKPKMSAREVFFNVAHRKDYFYDFGGYDETIGKVCDKFFEILSRHYEGLKLK